MNFTGKMLLLVAAVSGLAGCAGQVSQPWAFRFEDRAAIADLTSKLEAVTANLLAEVQQPMVSIGTERPDNPDSVRFFASDVKRFRIAVQSWQPQKSEDVGMAYTRMLQRWEEMRQRMATFPVNQQIRSRIQMCSTFVTDLGRYAVPRGASPAGVGKPAN